MDKVPWNTDDGRKNQEITHRVETGEKVSVTHLLEMKAYQGPIDYATMHHSYIPGRNMGFNLKVEQNSGEIV